MRTELKSKPKVLVFIDWYLPGYKAGGPLRSCSNLLGLLKDRFDFSVITTDTDHLERDPYPGIPADRWIAGPDGFPVFYISRGNISVKTIRKAVEGRPFDRVYLNSLFSLWFTIIPLLLFWSRRKDVVLAPRGMLAPDALRIKGLKKAVFLKLARITGLYRGVTWHAATPEEERDIRNFTGEGARVIIAANVPGSGNAAKGSLPKKQGSVNMYLAGRIAPIKNLHLVLEALNNFPPHLECRLDVIGPVDDHGYMDRCRILAGRLEGKSNVKVSFLGPVPHDRLEKLLKNYHFLVLPSASESFGHAILEALSSGIPSIISENTPWKGLEGRKAGWNVPLDGPGALLKAIERAAEMDAGEYIRWSAGAKQVVEDFRKESGLLENNTYLFS